MVDELAADAAGEQAVDLGQELVLVAGQEAAVELGLGVLGDDVDLVAGGEDGRVDGVGEGGADHPCDGAELGEDVAG